MLFKPYLIDLIRAGQKTQTRRRGPKPRYNAGTVCHCQTNYKEKGGPKIRITRVWRQVMDDVSEEEARREGFRDREDFYLAWGAINGYCYLGEEVWAYEFELVRDLLEQEAS